MKLECELIQDLLPLYEENICSTATRRAVEEHLCECESCRRLTAPLPIEPTRELPAADRAVKKSMKKVRRRWLASLLAAVLTVPLLLMCFNQYRGYGLCFTNLDDVYTAWRFLHALETEDWEKAARMYDFSNDYKSILDALNMEISDWGTGQEAENVYTRTHEDIGWVAELSETEFTREMIRRYTADLSVLEGTFECAGYRSCGAYGYESNQESWRVVFAVTLTQNGKSLDTELYISVSDGKIDGAGISHEPGIQWLDAIDRALYPSAHAGY